MMRAGWSVHSVAKTSAPKHFHLTRSGPTGRKTGLSRMFELILPHLPPGLQEAILSPEYSEVCVNEDGRVFVEAAGSNTMFELPGIAPTQVQLRHAVNAMARTLARCEADETNPILNARLPDGSRIAAMLPPVTEGVVLTIRKFRPNWFTLEELLANGTLSCAFYDQLIEAVERRQNILISGPTGSGKTTLVKALLDLIPQDERVLLIEDTAELPLDRSNCVRFTAREGVTIRDLLKASLRHRPDRILVGEVRDGAAYDLLQALNTGHAGSISTLHASSATHALNRLARLALQADTGLPFGSIQSEIGDAIQYVAHLERHGSCRELTKLIRVNVLHLENGKGLIQAIPK
jgi:pilus assembly protein CpaF